MLWDDDDGGARRRRGKAARRKGKVGERAARVPLEFLTGCKWERSAGQSRERGGEDMPDLICEERPGLHPEVKVGKNPPLYPALRQAKEDAGDDAIPFVLAKRDGEGWVLLVEVDRFHDLLRRFLGR